MPQEYIEVVIDEKGELESEVHGVLGPDCEKLVEFLEELGDVVEHHRTPDYRRQQRTARRVSVGR